MLVGAACGRGEEKGVASMGSIEEKGKKRMKGRCSKPLIIRAMLILVVVNKTNHFFSLFHPRNS